MGPKVGPSCIRTLFVALRITTKVRQAVKATIQSFDVDDIVESIKKRDPALTNSYRANIMEILMATMKTPMKLQQCLRSI